MADRTSSIIRLPPGFEQAVLVASADGVVEVGGQDEDRPAVGHREADAGHPFQALAGGEHHRVEGGVGERQCLGRRGGERR